MRSTAFKRLLTVSAITTGGLLAACGGSSGNSPFQLPPPVMPGPTTEPTPTPPPQALFEGDTAAFLVFLRDLDRTGDPVPVNDGNVVFNDTAPNTAPVPVNN